jgi:hypothetical protein
MDPSANEKGRTKLNASAATNPKFYTRAKNTLQHCIDEVRSHLSDGNKRHQSVFLRIFLRIIFFTDHLHSPSSLAFTRLLHSIFRSPFLYFKNIDSAEVTLSRLSLSATIPLSSGLIV